MRRAPKPIGEDLNDENPTFAAGIGQFAAIQAVGPIGIELSVIDLRDAGATERAIAAFRAPKVA